jgi:predicted PurR-regulated permease PerM
MKKIKEFFQKPWAGYTIATCSAVVLYLLLTHLPTIFSSISWFLSLISPVIIGAIVAYILNPLSNFFENKPLKKIKKQSLKHTVAVLLVVIIILILLSLLLAALIPSLISSIKGIIANRNEYISKISHFVSRFNNSVINLDVVNITEKINSAIDSLLNTAYKNLSVILTTVKDVGSSVVNVALGIVFGVCFLLGKDTILKGVQNLRRTYMTEERYEKNNTFWSSCHEIFTQYFTCTILDAFIIGVSNAILMAIFGLPNVALVSVIVGVTNIIPTFGPVIGAVLGAFLLVLDKPSYALTFLIFTVILQSLDGMVIKPKLFSNSLGLPAIWTIVAITLGGKLAGVPGIILSIPVAAILAILYKQTITPIMEKRKAKINSAPEKSAEEDKEEAQPK